LISTSRSYRLNIIIKDFYISSSECELILYLATMYIYFVSVRSNMSGATVKI